MRSTAIWNAARQVWENPHGQVDLFSTLSDVFSETWPTSGMTRDGVAFELPMLVPLMDVSGFSFLPTPQAHDAVKGKNADQVAAMRARGHGVWNLNEVAENELMSLLKTPTSQLAVNGGSQHPDKRKEGGHGPTLADEVEHLLPTPAAMNPNDGEAVETWEARRVATKARVKNGNGFGMPLAIAVQLLPTPTSAAALGGNLTRGGARSNELLLSGVAMSLLPTGDSTRPRSNGGSK